MFLYHLVVSCCPFIILYFLLSLPLGLSSYVILYFYKAFRKFPKLEVSGYLFLPYPRQVRPPMRPLTPCAVQGEGEVIPSSCRYPVLPTPRYSFYLSPFYPTDRLYPFYPTDRLYPTYPCLLYSFFHAHPLLLKRTIQKKIKKNNLHILLQYGILVSMK